MTARIIDMRLRKIEKQVGASALSRMPDEALDALVRSELEVAARPYNGNICALRDALHASSGLRERETAKHLDDILDHWEELYPPTKAG